MFSNMGDGIPTFRDAAGRLKYRPELRCPLSWNNTPFPRYTFVNERHRFRLSRHQALTPPSVNTNATWRLHQ
ncbi:hypothetical protein [Paraburkholderia adhaesiva]|uniref:hypothetical protein n=1 Tax=Paraburkholderia adhaesiva TaxID=2883244 RepID=UPI001F1FCABB|nr:hypothetical protein [Paraburkholderia adhaesiva]